MKTFLRKTPTDILTIQERRGKTGRFPRLRAAILKRQNFAGHNGLYWPMFADLYVFGESGWSDGRALVSGYFALACDA